MTLREEIVAALDDYLDIRGIHDSSLNGLQVEGADSVERVALAVDAAQATIDAAAENECQMLIIHHGLFWGPQVALTGMMGRRVRAAFDAGLSVYAAHLPLDAHQEVGNNVFWHNDSAASSTARSAPTKVPRSAPSRASRSPPTSVAWRDDSRQQAATSR